MSERYDFRGTLTIRLLRSLVEAQEAVRREAEAQIAPSGLTCSQFDCLVTLGVDQPLRMCDLAQRSLLTKSHTTQIVQQLAAKGLVHRQRSAECEREVIACLTPEGQALFERVYPAHYAALKEWFTHRLSGKEQEALCGLLARLAEG